MDKKTVQLGMNPGTASHRLVKDILWKLVCQTDQDICSKCSLKMDRDNFSIEHIIPWLDSEDPVKLFFDLDNISFSHHACNIRAARRKTKSLEIPHGTSNGYDGYKCRCTKCKLARSERDKHTWNTSENRRARYKRTGK